MYWLFISYINIYFIVLCGGWIKHEGKLGRMLDF